MTLKTKKRIVQRVDHLFTNSLQENFGEFYLDV